MRGRGGLAALSFSRDLSIIFRSNIGPSMGFLHVLLAVAFPFAFIGTRGELAFIFWRLGGVLVVDMAIPLLFCWPSKLVVFT